MTISAGLDRFTNNPQTTLSGNGGSITAGATSMKVASALAFPQQTTANFRVLIDSEIIQVYGGQSTTTWTILRAMEGTVAASHNDGATVTQMISAWEVNSFRQEYNVIAYGAAGDGVTDDSTAFQNAVNDAHAQTVGGVVFLPSMQFKVVSNLTTYSNVVFVTYGATLSGAGAGTVTPLIKWGLTGTLTIPAALTVSAGGAAITGAISSTSTATGTALIATGLSGATAASRYVGATASGAPTSGTFALGDFIVDQTGVIWICTTAGTPGTWTQVSGSLVYAATSDIQALGTASGGSITKVARGDHIHPTTNVALLNAANVFSANNTFNGGITGTLLTASQGNVTSLGTLTSLNVSGTVTIVSTASTALTVAASGSNYGLQVDESTASAATGLKIKAAASGSGLALSVISSGTNENLTLDAKGSGTIGIGTVSTGAITLGQAVTASGLITANGGLTMGGTLAKGGNALTGSQNNSDIYAFLASATGAQVWIQSSQPAGNNGDVWIAG